MSTKKIVAGYGMFGLTRRNYREKAEIIQFLIGDIIKKSKNILDIGSGNGIVVGYLEKWNHKAIVKIDLGGGRGMIKMDFLKNKFRDKEFDLLILNGIYDYIADKEKLLNEMNRVAKCSYLSLIPKNFYTSLLIDRYSMHKESNQLINRRLKKYFEVTELTAKLLPFGKIWSNQLMQYFLPCRKLLLVPKSNT